MFNFSNHTPPASPERHRAAERAQDHDNRAFESPEDRRVPQYGRVPRHDLAQITYYGTPTSVPAAGPSNQLQFGPPLAPPLLYHSPHHSEPTVGPPIQHQFGPPLAPPPAPPAFTIGQVC
jgi:hypothetical protein